MTRVSVKGVVIVERKVLLLRNERDEWELPGGKLEAGEAPEACCQREILEETALRVDVRDLIDAWVYHVAPEGNVLILSYGCALIGATDITISAEHSDGAWFGFDDIPRDKMPAGYVGSIERWRTRLGLIGDQVT